MSTAEKFDFESLSPQGAATAAAPQTRRKRTYTDAQIESVQQAAFDEGHAAGENAALDRVENSIAATLDQLSAQCESLLPEIDRKIMSLRAHSAELGLIIAKALAPALVAREPLAEIEALFGDCVSHLHGEPRIVMRVDETLVEPLMERIDTLAAQSGYPGRIVLIGEPGFGAADCQIEWVDGGAVRGSGEQMAEIEEIIARYVAGGDAPPDAATSLDLGPHQNEQIDTPPSDQPVAGDEMKAATYE